MKFSNRVNSDIDLAQLFEACLLPPDCFELKLETASALEGIRYSLVLANIFKGELVWQAE